MPDEGKPDEVNLQQMMHLQEAEKEFLKDAEVILIDALKRHHKQMLADFSERLKRAYPASKLNEQNKNYRTRYRDQGDWARHFSEVRMHTAIFLIGICAGIMALAHTEHKLIFIDLACVLWGIWVLMFLFFTIAEHKKSESQHKTRQILFPNEQLDHGLDGHQSLLRDRGLHIALLLTLLFIWTAWKWNNEIQKEIEKMAAQATVHEGKPSEPSSKPAAEQK